MCTVICEWPLSIFFTKEVERQLQNTETRDNTSSSKNAYAIKGSCLIRLTLISTDMTVSLSCRYSVWILLNYFNGLGNGSDILENDRTFQNHLVSNFSLQTKFFWEAMILRVHINYLFCRLFRLYLNRRWGKTSIYR